MDDVLVRLALVAVVGLAALGAAHLSRRSGQPRHPPVDLSGTDLPGGVVLFTSTDCSSCDEARAVLRGAGIEFREVTWELEASVAERAGVGGVPLAVFRDASGATVAQLAGVPRRAALQRALAAMSAPGQMLGGGEQAT